MSQVKHRVAVVGCGYMGQRYVKAYATYPDTELVAIVEANPDRGRAVADHFGVGAVYTDVPAMLSDMVPDIVAIATPTRFFKDAVLACAGAGVKGVSTEKPIAAVLSDADEMVDACRERGVVLAGGYLQRAMNEVQEAARRIHSGELGEVVGARVYGLSAEVSGAGCQNFSVLRLFTGAEVDKVIAWATPAVGMASHLLQAGADAGLDFNGVLRLSSGLDCPFFGTEGDVRGVDIWTDEALVRWRFGVPEIFIGYQSDGARKRIDPGYEPYQWSEFDYLTGSIRSFLTAVETGSEPWISGHDLRQALEIAIACNLSAELGSAPVTLPLKDRSLALYPSGYRWSGREGVGGLVSKFISELVPFEIEE